MGTRLGALDQLFLRLETPTTPMHVSGVLVFGPPVRARPHPDALRARPVQTSPFDLLLRRRGRGHEWERARDLTPPVGHVELPPPGDDRQLMAAVSRLHGRHLDRAGPLWECHVIDGLAGGRFALYYKIHHACIDGVSAIRRLEAALSADPDHPTPPVWAVEPERRPPRPTTDGGDARARPGVTTHLRTAAELTRRLGALAATARDRDPGRTATPYTAPDSVLNACLGAERSVAWQRLPLDGVRALAAATGTTINDVALALCGAVLREHLLGRDAMPGRPLVAMVPVSLRGTGPGAEAGNQVSSILCKLGTDLADPRARLTAVARSASDGKQMLRAMSPAAAAAFSLVYTLPAVAAQLAGLARYAPLPWNVVVSNVAGPRQQLYLDGAPLEAVYPVSLLFERQALNFTLVSCRDHLDVGLLACARSVPDLGAVATGLVRAYDELRTAVDRAGPASPPRPTGPAT